MGAEEVSIISVFSSVGSVLLSTGAGVGATLKVFISKGDTLSPSARSREMRRDGETKAGERKANVGRAKTTPTTASHIAKRFGESSGAIVRRSS